MASRKSKAEEKEPEVNDEGSEEQEADSQRRCLLCGEIPDSIICLNCGHNIDIPCATRVILESQTGDGLDISKLDCLLCGKTTYLSGEVQAAIIAYGEGEHMEGLEEGEEEMNGNEENGKEENEEGFEEEQSFRRKERRSNGADHHEKGHENSTSKKSKRKSLK